MPGLGNDDGFDFLTAGQQSAECLGVARWNQFTFMAYFPGEGNSCLVSFGETAAVRQVSQFFFRLIDRAFCHIDADEPTET